MVSFVAQTVNKTIVILNIQIILKYTLNEINYFICELSVGIQ